MYEHDKPLLNQVDGSNRVPLPLQHGPGGVLLIIRKLFNQFRFGPEGN